MTGHLLEDFKADPTGKAWLLQHVLMKESELAPSTFPDYYSEK